MEKLEVINYYQEIDSLIEDLEVNKKVREIKTNVDTLKTYWNIGRLLIEVQGGAARAKYGNGLINEWSKQYTLKYGASYDARNLRRMRKFYLYFPKWAAVRPISWTCYKSIISIKDANKRNYYINQVIINNLSTRDLDNLIRSNAFERLSYADKNNIKLIESKEDSLTIEDMIKDPILIEIDNNNVDNMNERTIHRYLISMLEDKFLELGTGFTLAGHEYKLNLDDKTYKIDLLFFNYELNSFVVVEIKSRELQPKDISQLEFYVNCVDKNIKKNIHNRTIGILIVKKNNKYVFEYTTSNDIYVTTYKLLNNKEFNIGIN